MSDRILPLQAVSTDVLRRYLFAISQYCRSVSDLTNEDKLAPTPFHSCEEPPISLGTYVIDLGRRLRLCRFTVLLATLYVGRMAQRTKRMPSILSIHRLFASAMLLACKALRDNVPSDDVFAQCAGFPPNEVSELQTAFQRTVGHDAHDYAVDLEAMHRHLEVASRTTLRSRITSAVANAFRVDPPMSAVPSPSRDVISISPVSPGLLSVMSPVFTSLCTTPLHSADPWRRSSDSQYVFGSGVTAARNLRSVSPNPEGLSFVLPPAEVEVTPSSPLPTFAIQMPRCLEEEDTIELPVTTDAPVAPSRPTRPRPFFMARRF